MPRNKPVAGTELGTEAYENWQAALDRRPMRVAYEVPLFTDAYVTQNGVGAESHGPYRFLITAAPVEYGVARGGVVVRVEQYYPPDEFIYRLSDHADDKRYHGADLQEELAALMSLLLGVRLKAGGICRFFFVDGDPRGNPYCHPGAEPLLLTTSKKPVLPRAMAERSVERQDLFDSLPSLDAKQAIALVRAARLYQDGLWIAESQPALSWLMLVSAVETAANEWCKDAGPPRDRLRSWMPDLEELLRPCGDPIVERVAEMVADIAKSTKKFLDFVIRFRPDPPDDRASEWQYPWEETSDLERDMRTIYRYRSNALHDGIPFPDPMCRPPLDGKAGDSVVYGEVPEADLTTFRGAVWTKKQMPMLLHTFEHMARGALCKWWESMIQKEHTAEGGCAT